MTMAPELGRVPNAETSTYGGGRGGAPLYRDELATSRGVGAPRSATSHSPSPVCQPAASVTFDGRTCGCLMSVTFASALVQHVYHVSLNFKSGRWWTITINVSVKCSNIVTNTNHIGFGWLCWTVQWLFNF